MRYIANATAATMMYSKYTMSVCLKKTGPMIGMPLKIGIGSVENPSGLFNCSGLSVSHCEYRKPVSPETRTLMTTPTMIWFTRYLIANTERRNETSMPAIAAAKSPANGEPVMVPTTAETKAPAKSWASIAMLTTPTRSEMTPPRAPNTRGTASTSEPANSSGTRSVSSAAAQVRKPVSAKTAPAMGIHRGTARF